MVTSGVWVEPGSYVDHVKGAQPSADPVQVPDRPLEASEMGEGDVMRGQVAFFNHDFGTDLTQRLSYRTVRIQDDITGDVGPVAAHAHLGEGQP